MNRVQVTLEELNKMLTSKEVSLSNRDTFNRNVVEIHYVKSTSGAPTGTAAVDNEFCLNTFESNLYLKYSGTWYKIESSHPSAVRKGMRYVHTKTGADTTGAAGSHVATNRVFVKEGNDAVAVSTTTVLKVSDGASYSTTANEYVLLQSVSTGGGKYLIEFDGGGSAAAVAGYTNITVDVLTGTPSAQAVAALVDAGIAALAGANADFNALAVNSYVVITDKKDAANTPKASGFSAATKVIVGANKALAYEYLAF